MNDVLELSIFADCNDIACHYFSYCLPDHLPQPMLYPPVDALSSLSRLLRHGAARDRADMTTWTSPRRRWPPSPPLAELFGAAALSAAGRRYQDFDLAFASQVISQGRSEKRPLEDTLNRAWRSRALVASRPRPRT